LIKIDHSNEIIGINHSLFKSKVARFSHNYDFYSNQLEDTLDEINQFIDGAFFGQIFKSNTELLKSFNELGDITAITLLTEMGNIKNFTKPQQLVAFLGLDPGVNHSGNFNGDRKYVKSWHCYWQKSFI
jgi:hypothetical protein